MLVAGRLQLRSYTDRNHVERTTAEIVVVTVQLLERKKEMVESANADAMDTVQTV